MDNAAKRELACKYANGDGVEQSLHKAVDLWTARSDGGCPESQCSLACSFGNGEGVPVNWPRAIDLFRASAAQGYCNAQRELGCRYMQGQVPGEAGSERFVKAAQWWGNS